MPLAQRDRDRLQSETFYRTLTLDRAEANDEQRTVAASLSSEVEIPRWFGREKLQHTPEAIDLHRAVDGLPMLFNHDRDAFLGNGREVAIEDGQLRSVLTFSQNSKATEIWGDVRDGFLKDISIGYRVLKWEEEADSDLITVTRWELFEVSVVTIPADQSVGIGRGADDLIIAGTGTQQRGIDMPGQTTGDDNVTDFQSVRSAAKAEGVAEGRRMENLRRTEIEDIFSLPRYQSEGCKQLKRAALDEGWGVSKTRDELLMLIGQDNSGPLGGAGYTQSEERSGRGGSSQIVVSDDSLDKFFRGAELALEVRTQLESDKEKIREARAGEFASLSMVELGREYLRVLGEDMRGLNRDGIVRRALAVRSTPGFGTSDFTNLLENITTKALLMGWTEIIETWSQIARIGNLPDFKQASRAGLSEFSDLDIVYENGDYKYGKFSDRAEKLTLVTYGKLFNISRQAIVNDDLSAFTMIPRKMGRAAQRKVGDVVYAILTGNPTLNQDSTALFHADHSNISTPVGAPSVSTLDVMRAAMATQTDQQAAAAGLNIPLTRVIVPVALQTTGNVLRSAQYDPNATAGTLTPNPFQGVFDVIADARLDADSTTQWYGSADPNLFDTIEVAFLDGQQEPYLESKEGWSVDGVEYKVRIDAVAAALGYQGLQRNAGA